MGKQPRSVRAHLDKHGRVVIPADMRKDLDMQPGEALTIILQENQLRIITLNEAVKRSQKLAREVTGGRTGLVDEFIAERRREAERE
jgi:AbrB family looped-hinge helix DNA binding protein